MAAVSLPELTVNKDEPIDGVKTLLKIINPDWNPETFHIEGLSGGYSSKIFKCCRNSEDVTDAVTVRVRFLIDTNNDQKKLVGRNQAEIQAIQHLSTTGHFPKIRAIFDNGYAYQFIKGKPVFNSKTMNNVTLDEKIIEATAKELAYIHSIHLEQTDNNTGMYFAKLVKADLRGPVRHTYTSVPSFETIFKEFEFAENYMKQVSSEVGLCHGDTHLANVIWNKDEEKVIYVDWEGAYMGCPYLDLAQFSANIKRLKTTAFKMPEDTIDIFLKAYYKESCVLRKSFNKLSFEDFNNILHKSKLMTGILYVSFPLIYPEVFAAIPGTDEMKYKAVLNNIEEYLQLKKELVNKEKFETEY